MFTLLLNYIFVFLRVSVGGAFPPPLPREEENLYFEKMKKGDEHARQILIEHNLRLVAHIAKKYYNSGEDQDDLISIGTIGLIKAVDTYMPESGTRFATYASKCLQNEILMYFRSRKKSACEVSLNETIDTDKDGNPLTYMDIICCEDTIADDLDAKTKSAQALQLINGILTDRERTVIVLRYGIGDIKPVTQRKIAQMLGISRSYVSRIEKAALDKIHAHMTGEKFSL